MLKAAVIGAGYIAREHLDALRSLRGVAIEAVCDLSPVMAEATADEFGARAWYTDHREMLSAVRPDVVHVTTPPKSHVRLALDAAVQEADLLRQEGRPLPFELSRLRLLLRMTELAQVLLRLLISLGSPAIPEGLAGWLRKAAQLTADLRSHGAS